MKVVAIEPSGSNAGRLLRSAALNGPGELIFVNAAVVSESFRDRFARIRVPQGNSAASSAVDSWNPGLLTANVESAPARTLDKILDKTKWLGRPRLIKLDVEGFEAQALEGAIHTIRNAQPIFLLEWATEYLRDPVGDWNAVSSRLKGYTFLSLSGQTSRTGKT